MELLDNNQVEEKEELYDDLIGRKLNIPLCSKCAYSQNGMCTKFNKSRLELLETKAVDLANCPYFEAKDTESVEKVKKMGFSGE